MAAKKKPRTAAQKAATKKMLAAAKRKRGGKKPAKRKTSSTRSRKRSAPRRKNPKRRVSKRGALTAALDIVSDPLAMGTLGAVGRIDHVYRARRNAGADMGTAFVDAVRNQMNPWDTANYGLTPGVAAESLMNGYIGSEAQKALGTRDGKKAALRGLNKGRFQLAQLAGHAVPVLAAKAQAEAWSMSGTMLEKAGRYGTMHARIHGGLRVAGTGDIVFELPSVIQGHGPEIVGKLAHKHIGPKINPKLRGLPISI